MGIQGVKITLGALHGIGAPTTGFLHHHRLNQKYIIWDSVFLGILLNDRFIILYFITDRKNLKIIFIAGKHHPGKAQYNHHDYENQYHPATCGKGRNQFLHGLCNRFGGFGSILSGFFCRNNRLLRGNLHLFGML